MLCKVQQLIKFHCVHFHPAPLADPPFRLFEGLTARLPFTLGYSVTTKKELLKSRSILGLGIKYSFLCMGILQISVFFSGV